MNPHEPLQPLLSEAERRGLWLYSAYQQLWFSPDELKMHNEKGRFRWGPANWELRDPIEYIAEKQRAVAHAIKELENAKNKIKEN